MRGMGLKPRIHDEHAGQNGLHAGKGIVTWTGELVGNVMGDKESNNGGGTKLDGRRCG